MANNIIQRAAQKLATGLGYKFNVPSSVGIINLSNPPEWNYEQYLKMYGQIGWLYAVVSVRASNIARNSWRLYRVNSQGERDEVDETDKEAGDLIRLIKHPNKFQTRYQFFYQHQNYKDLVGESFWQMNFTKGGIPTEMWLMPPAFTLVIPDPAPTGNYILGYRFKRGPIDIPFKPDEVIHIMHPNPFSPFRGVSPAQALTLCLSIDTLSRKHQERVFYNNAVPALVVSFAAADVPPTPEQRKELEQSFDARFRGNMNSGKTMFAYGSDVKAITVDNRQLDMVKLAKMTRDDILGAYNTHPSIVGISENVNRANADAANYQFALQVSTPELTDIREAFNQKLCPFFGDYLEFDFDNPVAEDVAQQAAILDGHAKLSILSLEEARAELDQGDINPDDHFLLAPGWQIMLGSDILNNTVVQNSSNVPAPKGLGKKKALSSEWKGIIADTEKHEKAVIVSLKGVFGSVEKDILKQLHEGKRPALDKAHFHTDYTEKVAPVLLKTCHEFIQTGRDMVTRSKSIKAVPNVTAWLNARATFASTSIVDTLNQALSASLAEGYANNEDMDDLADRVADVFGGQNGIDRNQLIARTETMYACNYGLTEGYKSMGVTKEKWLTADDERTCELCLDMDGEVFDIDDFPTPPQSTHPACRCCGKPYRGDEEAEDWGNDNG